MNAQDALRAGRLDDALKELQGEVRRKPADPRLRVFLFQLLCVRGEWNRALTQLTVAGELDAGALMMVQTYREALRCEVYRTQVFRGERLPMSIGQPEEWFAWLTQSLALAAQGHEAQAQELRGRAYEAAAPVGGMLNGAPFEWLADGDARLGPCLELIISGRYYWVPFARIQALEIEPPTDLRDLVWTPAHVTWTNGGQAVALIPTRYPGSDSAADSALQLARRTDWSPAGDDAYVGLGQRTFMTDSQEAALLDVRNLTFARTEDAAESAVSDPAVKLPA